MPKIIDDPVEEDRAIRPAAALVGRFNVDGDPPRLARRHDLDLVMRRCAIAALLGCGDRPPAQHPVFRFAHDFLLVGILSRSDAQNREATRSASVSQLTRRSVTRAGWLRHYQRVPLPP